MDSIIARRVNNDFFVKEDPVGYNYRWSCKIPEWSTEKLIPIIENNLFARIENEKKNFEYLVKLDDQIIGTLPRELFFVYDSIEKSKYILNLEKDFDDEGSLPYSKQTWEKTVKLIIRLSKFIFEKTFEAPIAPKIYHGPEGSIDVLWENKALSILMNIPQKGLLGNYYGHNHNGHEIEGNFPIENPQFELFPMLISL